jgi:hypothetical protein
MKDLKYNTIISTLAFLLLALACSSKAQSQEIATYYIEYNYKDTSFIQIRTKDPVTVDYICDAGLIFNDNSYVYSFEDNQPDWYEFTYHKVFKNNILDVVFRDDNMDSVSAIITKKRRKFK